MFTRTRKSAVQFVTTELVATMNARVTAAFNSRDRVQMRAEGYLIESVTSDLDSGAYQFDNVTTALLFGRLMGRQEAFMQAM